MLAPTKSDFSSMTFIDYCCTTVIACGDLSSAICKGSIGDEFVCARLACGKAHVRNTYGHYQLVLLSFRYKLTRHIIEHDLKKCHQHALEP